MKRILRTSAMIVLTLLAVGMLSLWVRSYWFSDRVLWNRCRVHVRLMHCSRYGFHSAGGLLELYRRYEVTTISAWDPDQTWWGYACNPGGRFLFHGTRNTIAERLGFRCTRCALPSGLPSAPPTTTTIVNAPHWFALLLVATYPLSRVAGVLRRRRRGRLGLCSCGYDLRGTVDRCPECGRRI